MVVLVLGLESDQLIGLTYFGPIFLRIWHVENVPELVDGYQQP
jgi:hypothetical protein